MAENGAVALLELLAFLIFVLAIVPVTANYCHTEYMTYSQTRLASELLRINQKPAVKISQSISSDPTVPIFIAPDPIETRDFLGAFKSHFAARSSGDIYLELYYLNVKSSDSNPTTEDAGVLDLVGGQPWNLIGADSYVGGASPAPGHEGNELTNFALAKLGVLQSFSDLSTPGADPNDISFGIKLFDIMSPIDVSSNPAVATWDYQRLRSFMPFFPIVFMRTCEKGSIPIVPEKLVCNNFVMVPRVPVGVD